MANLITSEDTSMEEVKLSVEIFHGSHFFNFDERAIIFKVLHRMVAIFHKNIAKPNSKFQYICGGSLVSADQVVTGEIKGKTAILRFSVGNSKSQNGESQLDNKKSNSYHQKPKLFFLFSAAHCIRNKGRSKNTGANELSLVFGAFDIENHHEPGRIIKSVSEIFVHENWNSYTKRFNDDIAVLVLEEDIQFSIFIRPICISDRIRHVEVGTVAGWGKTALSSSYHEKFPTQINVSMVQSNEECYEQENDLAPIGSRNSFCAGSPVVKVCSGDSGSALIVKIDDLFFLKGIVSAATHNQTTNCIAKNFTIFTDVTKYINFIDLSTSHVNNVRFDSLNTTSLRYLPPVLQCSRLEWQCMSEECIPLSFRCDGSFDCYDNSDEKSCRKFKVFSS